MGSFSSSLPFLLFALTVFFGSFVASAPVENQNAANEQMPCWKSKSMQRKEETRKRRLEVEGRLIEHHKRMIKYLETEPEKRGDFLKAELEKERLEQKKKAESLRKELLEKTNHCTEQGTENVKTNDTKTVETSGDPKGGTETKTNGEGKDTEANGGTVSYNTTMCKPAADQPERAGNEETLLMELENSNSKANWTEENAPQMTKDEAKAEEDNSKSDGEEKKDDGMAIGTKAEADPPGRPSEQRNESNQIYQLSWGEQFIN